MAPSGLRLPEHPRHDGFDGPTDGLRASLCVDPNGHGSKSTGEKDGKLEHKKVIKKKKTVILLTENPSVVVWFFVS